jgi:rod shape-determining protein MreD
MSRRGPRYALFAILLLLATLHFVVPGLVGDARFTPDFLLLAMLIYAIRARPGQAAIAGFAVGLVADSLTPAAFGAGALAYTAVAYLAAWGKAVFFAENLFVNTGFIFVGVWMRDLLVLLVGRPADDAVLMWQLVFWSPLKALVTAAAGAITLLVFRRALEVRISE